MTRKLILSAALAAVIGLAACNEKKPVPQEAAVAQASRQELESALSDRDSLINLMGDIQQSMAEIKDMENLISVDMSETPDRKRQLRQDLEVIKQTLADRRARLEELEKKLSSSSIYSQKLQNTINQLREQIDKDNAEIERLNTELTSAKEQITQLGTQVDSLNTTVTTVTEERNAAQEQAVQTANELNTCYYVVANNKALKEHKIVESGFLRKTKIMKGDFDRNFFVTADKRTLTEILTRSQKAEILTNQPAGSYRWQDSAGGKILVITDPDKFWSLSNYLVVKTN